MLDKEIITEKDFIDILANDLKDSNVIFLLDEPGVYLHVNAQRELLRLFYDLCKNDNQVVYSTHSPYMIDSNNIINIRHIIQFLYNIL